MCDTIFIEGIEFYAFHGVPDAERSIGHRYRVDIRLRVDMLEAGRSDSEDDTVDYAAVAAMVIQIGMKEKFKLLEALAARCCDAILAAFPKVASLDLEARKMMPPINGVIQAVGVAITRERQTSLV